MDGARAAATHWPAAWRHAEGWRLQLRHHLPRNHVPQRTILDRKHRHVTSRSVYW